MDNDKKYIVHTNFEAKEAQTLTFVRPATETLLYPDQDGYPWPKEISESEVIKKKTDERKEICSSLDVIFNSIPHVDMDVEEALELKLINPLDLSTVYKKLTDFLQTEDYGERIILYLPFELIPSRDWVTESSELNDSIKNFIEIYFKKWEGFLSVHDARTNFVDGDIPEGDGVDSSISRVSKVAHFIPFLIRKRIISIDQVINIWENTPDEILRESISDAVPVLDDLGTLSESILTRIEESSNSLVRNMAVIIKHNRMGRAESTERDNEGVSVLIERARSEEGGLQDYLKRDDVKTIAVVHFKSTFGTEIAKTINQVSIEIGKGNIIDEPYTGFGTNDYRTTIAKLKQAKADTVFLDMVDIDTVTFLTQAKSLNFSPKFITYVGSYDAFKDDNKSLLEGIVVLNWESSAPEFIKSYRKAYSTDPAKSANHAYDAVYVMAEAIAKTKTNADVANYISSNKFKTINGDIQFLGTHEVSSTPVEIDIYKGGSLIPLN
jgi:hypothetical protein